MSVLEAFTSLSGKILIDGQVRASRATEASDTLDPATEARLGHVAEATDAEIDEAVAGANKAQKAWAARNALARAEALHEIAHRLRQRRAELAEAMTRDMGKPFKESSDEVEWSATAYDYFAEVARADQGRIIGPVVDGQTHLVTKHPLGVAAIIMPFNYPFVLFSWEASAALATGNAVVLKPSEYTTLSSLLMLECFDHLPCGLVQCVTGGARVGARLVEHPDVHCVAFTGSIKAGQAVAKACAGTFKRVLIEASGNDPFIVMPSAPLDIVAKGAVFSAYINCGQICARAERFYVHQDVHDEFVRRVTDLSKAIRIGNGLDKVDVGPLVSARERDRYEGLVKRTLDAGARLHCGGGRPSQFNRGFFVDTTVLSGVDQRMEIMRNESFGPVMPICRVKDLDEAIAHANDSQYALGSVIYTMDLKEAMRATNEIQAGMTWVNAPLLDNDAGPFGGWKMSGTGSQLGTEGLEQFRKSKMVMIDPNCSDHDFWWYPYKDAEAFKGEQGKGERGKA
ncbi:MAG: aldehyde dehydrogenase [Alphaproteobacteria bacterium]|nr:aldehyde dehydrogenase [Alphaproteobacteria bacterium]